jgi:hypothetical protein
MRAPKQFRRALGPVVAALCVLALVTPASASSPVVEGESISEVSSSDATLEAVVNPGTLEAGAYYQFQIVASPNEYWPEVTCPEQDPEAPEVQCLGPYGTVDGPPPAADIQRRPGDLPTIRLGGGSEGVRVALRLSSIGRTLQPDTTYHYRVLAVEAASSVDSIVWEPPPTYGPDQTFTTAVLLAAEEGGPSGGAQPEPPTTSSEPTLSGAEPVGCKQRSVRRRHPHGHLQHRRLSAKVSLCEGRPAR